ncbi:MAG: hypothetical protein ABL904_21325 [Hyphomicrobiaceae bacterium]
MDLHPTPAWLSSALCGLLCCSLLAGCASKEQIAAYHDKNRAGFQDEMMQVIRHVKPEHLDQCRKSIAPASGSSTRITGELAPHTRASCMAQISGRMGAELGITRTRLYAAYAAPTVGQNIFGVATKTTTGCKFVLENGRINVEPGIEMVAPRTHPCWTMF